MRAGRLLLDDGNPFLLRPKTCDVDQAGLVKSISLNWRVVDIDQLNKTYWKSVGGEAGFGVRSVGKGYWISIQALEPKAQPVIDRARATAASLRDAAFVLIDLRGNGGGNDAYGRNLAEALYGSAYVEAKLGVVSVECASVFRASPGNIAAVRDAIIRFRSSGDTDAATSYEHSLKAMQAARAEGRDLTGPSVCKVPAAKRSTQATSLMHAPVIVLSDVVCFSSCINTVNSFRNLGAIHAGQITGAATHYSEVREITLPSGLATFSTLMALMPDAPPRVGPYVPNLPYEGDISDTATLETWILANAMRR